MVGNRVQLSCILIKTDGKSDQYEGGIDIQNATILIGDHPSSDLTMP